MITRSIVAKHMDGIGFAGIRKVFEKANKLAAQGVNVIHFEIGRPDFDTPLHIKEAAKTALDQGHVHYAPNAGIPALRTAVAAALKKNWAVDYDPEQEIFITAGGQEAMYLALMSIIDPRDEVLLPDPGFGLFYSAVRLTGGAPVRVGLLANENFSFDFDEAKKAITSRTRAMIVNSPHNPTGSVLSKAQVEQVADFAARNGLILISDETYDRMTYDGAVHHSPAAFPGMKEKTIICGSLSKTYAMTGWRIGYMAAPASIINAAIRLQQNLMVALCTFAQMGAVAALTGNQDCVDKMVREFARRRELMVKLIEKIPGLKLESIPRGAFYVYPKVTLPGVSSEKLADYLLDKTGVAVVDGSNFGSRGSGYLRMSYATSFNDCQEGLTRIAAAMINLAEAKERLE
jgi:aspartate/methionine/tyrosine aminotransferase